MAYETERARAIDAVVKACQLCAAVQVDLLAGHQVEKADRSPVTVADYGAQAVVASLLQKHFPADPLVGEEEALELRKPESLDLRSKVVRHARLVLPELDEAAILDAIDHGAYAGRGHDRHWTLDPIDGTKGFLRREQYAVALALIEEGQVVLGVLGCPNLSLDGPGSSGSRVGCVFVALRGQGAFMRALNDGSERRIRVSPVVDPKHSSFCESVESGHSSHGDSRAVAELLGVTAPPVRMDSQAKYGCVARGDAAIYLRLPTQQGYQEKVWDHAAGSVMIVEAGGKVTDCRGAPLDFSLGRTLRDNLGVVATNGLLHDRVIAAVRRVLAI